MSWLVTYREARSFMPACPQGFSTKCRLGDTISYAPASLGGVRLAFRRPIVLLGIAAVAAMSLSARGRNGALELPPGPAGIQPAPVALNWPPPGPVAAGTSDAGPAGVQPVPAALSGPSAGPVAADTSGAPRSRTPLRGPVSTCTAIPRPRRVRKSRFSSTRCCSSGSCIRGGVDPRAGDGG
jgi:hypothetical protein